MLRRKVGERVVLEGGIEVEFLHLKGNQVALGFVAPPEVSIFREELIQGREDDAALRRAEYRKGDEGR